MPSFPSNGELLLPYGETPESAVLRTEMESGPAKQAMVRTRQSIGRPVSYRFSSANYIAFKTWYRDDIKRGALWFDWRDPLNDKLKQARMVGGVYEAQAYDPGQGPLSYDVTFQIETWDD